MERQSKSTVLNELKNGSYYYITNQSNSLTLTYSQKKLTLQPIDPNKLSQIWMVEEVDTNKYELVHAFSTMVLTYTSRDAWLESGTQKSNQLFFVQKSNPKNNPNEYWIKQSKLSNKHLFYDVNFKCEECVPQATKARWQLTRIDKQNQLLQSCLLQFAYSGLYLDVPGASQREGETIIQYKVNRRCNQRWKIRKVADNAYLIISFKSGYCLSIKNQKERPGQDVVQEKFRESDLSQIWSFDKQAQNLYIISSKLKSDLYLGVRDNSMNEEAAIVTTSQQEYAFWRILGKFEE